LDLRGYATVTSNFIWDLFNCIEDESAKLAIYDLYGVVSLEGFINANKFESYVLNRSENRWYRY
jgi:hypothetical protein